MHGWMTSRHESCVSTDAHRKRLEYCTVGTALQGDGAINGGCKPKSTALRGVFSLDNAALHPDLSYCTEVFSLVPQDIASTRIFHSGTSARGTFRPRAAGKTQTVRQDKRQCSGSAAVGSAHAIRAAESCRATLVHSD